MLTVVIGHWMSASFLKLNTDKTKSVSTVSRHNLSLPGGYGPYIQLGDDVIKVSDHVRLLGATTSADLSLERHVSNVCFFWLRQIKHVHRSIDTESCKDISPRLCHIVH